VLWEKDLEKLKGTWARYRDVDGDGIPYRTVPGNRHHSASWFARGTGHDEYTRYSEDAGTWESNMMRIKKKYETARTLVPKPVIQTTKGATIGIIAFGSTEAAVEEAREILKQDKNLKTDFLRLRALPCTQEVFAFIEEHEHVYIVEANRDGQLRQILSTVVPPEQVSKFRSACHSDGLPLTAGWVEGAILAQEKD
jgi:2-oxoglutarate ferredoxin oxidoreductase subunit alpha